MADPADVSMDPDALSSPDEPESDLSPPDSSAEMDETHAILFCASIVVSVVLMIALLAGLHYYSRFKLFEEERARLRRVSTRITNIITLNGWRRGGGQQEQEQEQGRELELGQEPTQREQDTAV
ncbi:hypothetical protein TeGR_g4247 [Tetraparma gracilis]|uniref:Uncharacterized protein n=1 Tax=Tetraparma gracilis TaxID=2962635 RepID=A0ABQ6N9D2_9STRA|nr:hypothetical protein TeGR_g4247 [Tetraparma gracilis]